MCATDSPRIPPERECGLSISQATGTGRLLQVQDLCLDDSHDEVSLVGFFPWRDWVDLFCVLAGADARPKQHEVCEDDQEQGSDEAVNEDVDLLLVDSLSILF